MLDTPNVSKSERYGANGLARYNRKFSETSDLTLQLYYDFFTQPETIYSPEMSYSLQETTHTADVDLLHRFRFLERHDVVWGAQFRYQYSNYTSTRSDMLFFAPEQRADLLASLFVQDDISLIGDELRLILGSKFEVNNITGMELEPNIRLLWAPDDFHTVWLAASRAVRTPSRLERDIGQSRRELSIRITPEEGEQATLSDYLLVGNSDLASEELLALEAGWRWRALDELVFDLAGYYNFYTGLAEVEPLGVQTDEGSSPFSSDGTLLHYTATYVNKAARNAYGLEAAADWKALDWLRFKAAFSHHRFTGDHRAVGGVEEQSMDCLTEGSLRSWVDLPWDLEADLWLRGANRSGGSDIAPYLQLDARLAWKALENLELALVGRNLFGAHTEYVDEIRLNYPTQVEPSAYLKVTWRF